MSQSHNTLSVRLERVEGKTEDRFRYNSNAFSMKKVKESLAQLQRQSMSQPNAKEPHVILEGAMGSGQEGIARMIHLGSRRGKGPWLHVIGGETETHDRDLTQALLCAEGGTVYISNIEKFPVGTQKRLATQLATRDIRCIVSCGMDPDEAKEQGMLDGDLMHALGQMWIQIPALVERQEDILPLARAMAEKIAAEMGREFKGFASDAEQWLQTQPWKGGMHELWATLERSMYSQAGVDHQAGAAASDSIEITSAPTARAITEIGQAPQATYTDLKKQWVDHFEKEYLKGLVARHRGNVSASAREARLDRSNFLRLLRRHGLKAEAFREGGAEKTTHASDSEAA